MKNIDFIEITKNSFLFELSMYRKVGDENAKKYHYNRACAIESLLAKFGLTKSEINELTK